MVILHSYVSLPEGNIRDGLQHWAYQIRLFSEFHEVSGPVFFDQSASHNEMIIEQITIFFQ
jgi:hypothetical protein